MMKIFDIILEWLELACTLIAVGIMSVGAFLLVVLVASLDAVLKVLPYVIIVFLIYWLWWL